MDKLCLADILIIVSPLHRSPLSCPCTLPSDGMLMYQISMSTKLHRVIRFVAGIVVLDVGVCCHKSLLSIYLCFLLKIRSRASSVYDRL